MNIAFVTSHVYPYRKGGTERRVHEIAERLAASGHNITIYGCKWWDGPSEIVHEGVTIRGVCEGQDPYLGDRRSITAALRFSAYLLVSLLRHGEDHDLLVGCVSEHFPVWVTAVVSTLRGTDHVTTWHEVWDHEYWREYLGILGTVGWFVQYVTANLPQRPVAVSEMTAERLHRLRHGRGSIEVIPNGINVERIESTSPAQDGHQVLYVGRLIREKNVGSLLTAFDEVADSHGVTLGIIGDGPERKALVEQADSLRHADRVEFLGFVEESDEVYSYMTAADVFVMPSTREGFGITVLEAMAAECVPVVVSHENSAASEVVGETGFLAEPTPSSLAANLNRALAGEHLELDPSGRAREFDWDVAAGLAERFYMNALEDRPGQPRPREGRRERIEEQASYR
jgi:glycosyltransferase involved in cell wall biosynthesis